MMELLEVYLGLASIAAIAYHEREIERVSSSCATSLPRFTAFSHCTHYFTLPAIINVQVICHDAL